MRGVDQRECWSHRILQIHPTLRCNLRCSHCYSQSSADQKGELPLELIQDLLANAVEEGYAVAGFSGGEPTLYSHLEEALRYAKQCGMFTTVTSNGGTLTQQKLTELSGIVDLLAISVDGHPRSHNTIRASDKAFGQMQSKLQFVRDSGIPFGFIFTLTQHNLDELPWVADFALAQGASLLQIHPLENAGRAQAEMPDQTPDEIELAHAFLLIEKLREIAGNTLFIQFDAADRDVLQEEPGRVLGYYDTNSVSQPLAEYITPLIVESDGEVVPIRHGLSRVFSFGNLFDAPLSVLKEQWIRDRFQPFSSFRNEAFESLMCAEHDLPFFNWFDLLARHSLKESSYAGEK